MEKTVPQYKDYFGANLSIGDWVAVEQPSYRNLVTAKVVGFTPKQVRLQYYYQKLWRDYLCPPRTMIRAPDHLQLLNKDIS
jgi:hypothetical protein